MAKDSSTADPKTAAQIVTIGMELLGSEPVIWRRVESRVDITLLQLHRLIQAAMGWEDDHLWEFRLGKQRISNRLRLREILRPRKTRIGYLYDFGDSWEMEILVSDLRTADPAARYPRLIDGQSAPPPEDCGGLWGFYARVEALGDPNHPEHEDALDWLGSDFDVNKMDMRAIAERFSAFG